MIRIPKSLGLVAFTLASHLAVSGESMYTCNVTHIYYLQADGSLKAVPLVEEIAKKHSFNVSRVTGALTGESASLDTSGARETRVLSRGSKENSFRAIADFGVFPNGTRPYQLIEIQEFDQGPDKPFILMGELGIVTGSCR